MANTIRIDTANIGVSWALGETYRVQMDEGFLSQDGGLRLPISGGNITTFSTPAFAPRVSSTNPTSNTTASGGFQTISATFDRANVTVLSGNVFLFQLGSPNVLIKTQLINSSNTTGNTVTMNIVGNIIANETYFLTANANIFQDRDGFKNSAITNSSIFKFTSPTAPNVISTYPANASVAAGGITDAVLTFNRTIQKNTGNIYLFNANTNVLVKRYDISEISNSPNPTDLSISLIDQLEGNVYYYFLSNANIAMDSTQIKSPGLPNPNYFRAPAHPHINYTIPNNNTQISNANIILAFNRFITSNAGNVYLINANTNQIVNRYIISSNVTVSDGNVGINAYGLFDGTSYYTIVANANIVQDSTHIKSNLSGNLITFSTPSAPVLISTYPTNGNTSILENSIIYFTLDQNAAPSTGNIYLYGPSNTLIKTYNINSEAIFDSANIKISIEGQLDPSKAYYVTTSPNVAQVNLLGIKFAGISSASVFGFTTDINFSRDLPNTFILGSSTILGNTGYSANSYNLRIRTVDTISSITGTGISLSTVGNVSANTKGTIIPGYRGTPMQSGAGRGGAGGGGGAGGPGEFSIAVNHGNKGGPGILSAITGNLVYYAGGGGGGAQVITSLGGAGGAGGGGAGGHNSNGNSASYYGSGGGGAGAYGNTIGVTGQTSRSGGNGYNGIVIVRYCSFESNANVTGGTVDSDGDFTIHSFVSDDYFTITSDVPTLVDYLIVGGGGGGGAVGTTMYGSGGGGGGGGVKYGSRYITSGSYQVYVGSGGAGGLTTVSDSGARGQRGNTSSIFGIGAEGGAPGAGTELIASFGFEELIAISSFGNSSGGGATNHSRTDLGDSGSSYSASAAEGGYGRPPSSNGPTYSYPYTSNISITGTLSGNLKIINQYLSNLTITTLSGTTTPYNLNYRLINGLNESTYRIADSNGNVVYRHQGNI